MEMLIWRGELSFSQQGGGVGDDNVEVAGNLKRIGSALAIVPIPSMTGGIHFVD